jgi:hypothetical protein
MLLQNVSRDQLPRKFIQPIQALLHVMHEDDPVSNVTIMYQVTFARKNSRAADGGSPDPKSKWKKPCAGSPQVCGNRTQGSFLIR